MQTNKVILVGYVGKDIIHQQLSGGHHRTSLRVATQSSKKDSYGKACVQTTWHDVVAWDATAVYMACNLVKGSRVMVEGSIEYRRFADRDGETRYITQINAHSLMNLDR